MESSLISLLSHYNSQANASRECIYLYLLELEIHLEFRICIFQSGTILFTGLSSTSSSKSEQKVKGSLLLVKSFGFYFFFWVFPMRKMRMWLPPLLPFSKHPYFSKSLKSVTHKESIWHCTWALYYSICPTWKYKIQAPFPATWGKLCTARHQNKESSCTTSSSSCLKSC